MTAQNTTLFKELLKASGMTEKEAVVFLDVRPDTVESWVNGRRRPSPGPLKELASLVGKQISAAGEAVEATLASAESHGQDGGEVELGFATDDHEAQSLDWPTATAHRRVLALAAADLLIEGFTVKLVPRGSTLGTAGAADLHGQ